MSESSDRRAVGLYAVLDRDASDFIDMVMEEQDVEALKTLYVILATPNPKLIPEQEQELNAIGASIVSGNLTKRGVAIPSLERPKANPPRQGELF